MPIYQRRNPRNHSFVQSNAFIELISTFDNYERTIIALYNQVSNSSFLTKLSLMMDDKYYVGFKKRLVSLKKKLENKKKISSVQTHNKPDQVNVIYPQSKKFAQSLCTSQTQAEYAKKCTNIVNDFFTQNQKPYLADNKIGYFINNAIDELPIAKTDHSFVFNCALINHTLCDMYNPTETSDQNLFKHALTTFVTNLNPVSQVRQWVDFVIDTAHFVTDITIGKLYLSPYQYQSRINHFSTILSSFSWQNISQLNAEQWVEIGAQLAADCIFASGLTKVAKYLKKLEYIAVAQKNMSQNINTFKEVICSKLSQNNFVINTDGTVTKQITKPPIIDSGNDLKKIICPKRHAVEIMSELLNQEVKIEVATLRKKYDLTRRWLDSPTKKYVKIPYQHIFGIELSFNKKGRLDIGGFHLDRFNRIEKSGIIEFRDKVMYKDAFYEAKLFFNNRTAKYQATFFPAHWSREQVVETILETYDDYINNRYTAKILNKHISKIRGRSKNNIQIEIVITANGKIKTAYPVLN